MDVGLGHETIDGEFGMYVLILVLVDVGLGLYVMSSCKKCKVVLILVLVDVGLGHSCFSLS